MKYLSTLLIIFSIQNFVNAQQKWFSVYTDSSALVHDADIIIQKFTHQVEKDNPDIKMNRNHAVKNTTPYLIFIDSVSVNLPLWQEVISPQKAFFAEVSGGEKSGEEVFGLFFNGYFLAHELGHSVSAVSGKKFDNAYDSEYDANIIGILYWKSTEEIDELKKCYEFAKKILKNLKNPVPENEDFKTYITENYNRLSADPYMYGYIQFSQFVEIFENESLPDFDNYIKNYSK